MTKRKLVTALLLASAAATLSPFIAEADDASPPHKPDLGDAVQGDYAGAVISDSKGSSKSDVAITIRRIGKNRVEIKSDYPRLPTVTARLTRATGKILNAGGPTTFFYDPAKSPPHLDLTFNDEVSWSGEKS